MNTLYQVDIRRQLAAAYQAIGQRTMGFHYCSSASLHMFYQVFSFYMNSELNKNSK